MRNEKNIYILCQKLSYFIIFWGLSVIVKVSTLLCVSTQIRRVERIDVIIAQSSLDREYDLIYIINTRNPSVCVCVCVCVYVRYLLLDHKYDWLHFW